MSSAALQSAPHQTTTSSSSPAAAPVAAAPLHSPPLAAAASHHPYHASSDNSVDSPSSGSKRPSRKHSAASGGATKGDHSAALNAPMTSRAALASPIPVNTTYADQNRPPSSDPRRKNMPSATVPPRSSSQLPQPANGAARKQPPQASQRYQAAADPNAQPYQDDMMAQSSRSRRSASNHRDSSRAAAGSSTSVPIRSQQQQQPPQASPQGPSREASEILNSMLVSQPEVDIDRERERAALAHPHATDEATSPPGIPTPVDQQLAEEPRRGGRSRHDYSKREKHTKFGEYILGNTIGEGEFGKVKLGWKQEGGVQVRIEPQGGADTRMYANFLIFFFPCFSSCTGCHQAHQEGPTREQPLSHGQDYA